MGREGGTGAGLGTLSTAPCPMPPPSSPHSLGPGALAYHRGLGPTPEQSPIDGDH